MNIEVWWSKRDNSKITCFLITSEAGRDSDRAMLHLLPVDDK